MGFSILDFRFLPFVSQGRARLLPSPLLRHRGMRIRDDGMNDHDDHWMNEALAEARLALEHDDVPIGAVAVHEGRVVGRGHNERELRQDPTAHAEVLALQAASRSLGTWYLTGVTLFVTLEPCAMCAGAIVLARVARVVWAADDPKAGAAGSVLNVLAEPGLNHHPEITRGVGKAEAAALLKAFFEKLREG